MSCIGRQPRARGGRGGGGGRVCACNPRLLSTGTTKEHILYHGIFRPEIFQALFFIDVVSKACFGAFHSNLFHPYDPRVFPICLPLANRKNEQRLGGLLKRAGFGRQWGNDAATYVRDEEVPPFVDFYMENFEGLSALDDIEDKELQALAEALALHFSNCNETEHKKAISLLTSKTRSNAEKRAYLQGLLALVLSAPELCHTVRSAPRDLDGGIAASVCACAAGVVHSLKRLESSESVVDIADLVLSLLILPNVVGHDNADGLARHLMVRCPELHARLGKIRQGAAREPGGNSRPRPELRPALPVCSNLDPVLLALLRAHQRPPLEFGGAVHPLSLTGAQAPEPELPPTRPARSPTLLSTPCGQMFCWR